MVQNIIQQHNLGSAGISPMVGMAFIRTITIPRFVPIPALVFGFREQMNRLNRIKQKYAQYVLHNCPHYKNFKLARIET